MTGDIVYDYRDHDYERNELGERVTLITVPGAAHLLPLEQPETTASHMISFIRQLVRKP